MLSEDLENLPDVRRKKPFFVLLVVWGLATYVSFYFILVGLVYLDQEVFETYWIIENDHFQSLLPLLELIYFPLGELLRLAGCSMQALPNLPLKKLDS